MRASIHAIVACMFLGCAPTGFVYTHTIRPLDTNLGATGLQRDTQSGDVRTLTLYNVSVQWGGNGIGEIAKAKGMSRVYYADLETLSVLGVWSQQWVHLYGERATR